MIELNIPEAPAVNSEAPAATESAPASEAANSSESSQVATESSAPSPSTPATPTVEPKYEIKVDGKVESLTLNEMVALAQQGKSYTQKTQKLADEQRRWEADRQAILQQERDRAIQDLRAQEQRAALEAQKDPTQRAVERVEALEQRLEDQQLEGVLNSLKSKFPDMDEQQFLIEASKAGLRSASDVSSRGEEIAKSLVESQGSRFESRFKETLSKGEHPELKQLQAKWLADYLAKKGSGPSPAVGNTPSLGAPPKRVAKTFDEAADIAEEMLTGIAPRH